MRLLQRFREWRKREAGKIVKRTNNYTVHKKSEIVVILPKKITKKKRLKKEGSLCNTKSVQFKILDKNGKTLGKAYIAEKSGNPFGLYVKPRYRGQGLGTELVKQIIKELKNRKFKKIYVQVAEEAIDFYKQLAKKNHQKIEFTTELRSDGKQITYLNYTIK